MCTTTTEHTNINSTNNNDTNILKPPSSQNFSMASLNTEKPHCFAWSKRASASFGEDKLKSLPLDAKNDFWWCCRWCQK